MSMDDRSEDEQIKGKADSESEDTHGPETTEDEAADTSENSDQGGNAPVHRSENTARSFSSNMNIARLLSIVMLIPDYRGCVLFPGSWLVSLCHSFLPLSRSLQALARVDSSKIKWSLSVCTQPPLG